MWIRPRWRCWACLSWCTTELWNCNIFPRMAQCDFIRIDIQLYNCKWWKVFCIECNKILMLHTSHMFASVLDLCSLFIGSFLQPMAVTLYIVSALVGIGAAGKPFQFCLVNGMLYCVMQKAQRIKHLWSIDFSMCTYKQSNYINQL